MSKRRPKQLYQWWGHLTLPPMLNRRAPQTVLLPTRQHLCKCHQTGCRTPVRDRKSGNRLHKPIKYVMIAYLRQHQVSQWRCRYWKQMPIRLGCIYNCCSYFAGIRKISDCHTWLHLNQFVSALTKCTRPATKERPVGRHRHSHHPGREARSRTGWWTWSTYYGVFFKDMTELEDRFLARPGFNGTKLHVWCSFDVTSSNITGTD